MSDIRNIDMTKKINDVEQKIKEDEQKSTTKTTKISSRSSATTNYYPDWLKGREIYCFTVDKLISPTYWAEHYSKENYQNAVNLYANISEVNKDFNYIFYGPNHRKILQKSETLFWNQFFDYNEYLIWVEDKKNNKRKALQIEDRKPEIDNLKTITHNFENYNDSIKNIFNENFALFKNQLFEYQEEKFGNNNEKIEIATKCANNAWVRGQNISKQIEEKNKIDQLKLADIEKATSEVFKTVKTQQKIFENIINQQNQIASAVETLGKLMLKQQKEIVDVTLLNWKECEKNMKVIIDDSIDRKIKNIIDESLTKQINDNFSKLRENQKKIYENINKVGNGVAEGINNVGKDVVDLCNDFNEARDDIVKLKQIDERVYQELEDVVKKSLTTILNNRKQNDKLVIDNKPMEKRPNLFPEEKTNTSKLDPTGFFIIRNGQT